MAQAQRDNDILKKAYSNICISHICKLFNMPLSTYYDNISRPDIVSKNIKIINQIKLISKAAYHTYGSRRMSISLQLRGISCGRFRTRTLMKAAGIRVLFPKKKHRYPADDLNKKAPELLNRKFNQPSVNTHWVGDITYLRTHRGWSYLACVMDLGNKEVVGYALSQTADAKLVKTALMDAVRKHRPDTSRRMFHSDQGVQYSAKDFTKTLELLSFQKSIRKRPMNTCINFF